MNTKKPVAFLDLCSISYLKDQKSIFSGSDAKKVSRLNSLLELKEKYQYSFSLAILEKCTDFKNNPKLDVLVNRFIKDYELITNYIDKDYILETPEHLQKAIEILMVEGGAIEKRGELSIPSYLDFLRYYNTLAITNTPPVNRRYDIAKLLVTKGVELNFSNSNPVIAICIAAIYGCSSARDILKIKNNPESFNPNNCLGDILTLSRFAKFQSIRPDSIFRTEDTALEEIHSYLNTCLIETGNGYSVYKTCVINETKVLPSLFKDGICFNEKELNDLKELLGWI